MHWVLLNLDIRAMLTRRLDIKKWLLSDEEVAEVADQVRERMYHLLRQGIRRTDQQGL
jgi:hypothetical protein